MDMDMDNMFPRTRLGRLHHDPFAGFGGSHFGFPQFSTMGRRGRAAGGANNPIEQEDDFFNRLPSEFRQYIPEGFGGSRRTAGGPERRQSPHRQQPQPQQQQQPQQPRYPSQYQQQPQQPPQQNYYQEYPAQMPQSPSKRLCDAAIQTEDPVERSEVDCAPSSGNLSQHGLRNTMDMGVKSAAEQEQAARSHSAPPPEQLQQNMQYQQQHQQPASFGTQTSPPVVGGAGPQFQKAYYAPQQQAHPQQKQQTPPPPQTPNGTYVRTIPIFVEGRSEPIINAHKEIPNQNAPPGGGVSAQARAYAPPPQQQQQQQPQQQHRPAPLNTQQQQQHQQQGDLSMPPQTPHTLDSIGKIQDIQRDVLDLMSQVEGFKGARKDKDYVYLDEMLTRNLLKLDTIDTNGKESIRLARKEAIKCIQASINVLEAKAEENARVKSGQDEPTEAAAEANEAETAESAATAPTTPQPADATKIQEPIPLPPPPSAAAAAAAVPVEASAEATATAVLEKSNSQSAAEQVEGSESSK